MERRLESDGALYPNRVIVATETHAPAIDAGWAAVTAASHVIGDFTWTGWDYLGEAGIGRVEFGDAPTEGAMGSFLGAYPWLTAWCGDIDITGQRRPQSYYREIVFGRRTDPYIAVGRPRRRGQVVVHSSPWSWSDVVSSWSWDGSPASGAPTTVEVYADADEVELFLNDRSLGTRPVGAAHRFRAEFEVAFAVGSLEAVARRRGQEVGRTTLRSATGPVQLAVHADRTDLVAGTSDLAFIELTLVDEAGTSFVAADRLVTVEVQGPGKIQGLGSANPITQEPFTGTACTTFEGRALAVVRPTGDGVITLVATADGCAPRQVLLNVRR
jgi:beta-galactosidase